MKNDTIRNITISLAVFVTLLYLMPKLAPMPPQGPSASPSDTSGGPDSFAQTQQGSQWDSTSGSLGKDGSDQGGYVVMEDDAIRTMAIGASPHLTQESNAKPDPYRTRLNLINLGASVVSAALTDHAAKVDQPDRYNLLIPIERPGQTPYYSLAIEKINLDGNDLTLSDKRWHVGEVEFYKNEKEQGQQISFHLEIERSGKPVIRIVRTFSLPQQEVDAGRHDLYSHLSLENLSNDEHQIVLSYRGGMGVQQEGTRFDDRAIDWGIAEDLRVTGNRQTPSKISSQPTSELELFKPTPDNRGQRPTWFATDNKYFTCTLAPVDAQTGKSVNYFSLISAVDLDGDATTVDDVTIRFITKPIRLPSGQKLTYLTEMFLGEKNGTGFQKLEPYKSRNYYYQVEQGYGMCTFSWLVEFTILLLNGVYSLGEKVWFGDFGVAIMILVLIVRSMLHPITKKGQMNMFRMQQNMADMAPRTEELKRKYANDKLRLQQETMKLYREKGINPATQILTCLPMMIQLPIWAALFMSLSNNILMRHETSILVPWVTDLTAPDALYTFATPWIIPIVGWSIPSFNVLPLLVAIFMYTQQKMQPKPEPNPNQSEQQKSQQEMMQKMMPMMSIMMLLFFYKMPSGLNLYIFASSLFGTIEQHFIRKHIKELKEKGTLIKPKDPPPDTMETRRRPGKMGFFEKLQKMAEDAQKKQPARPAKNKRR